jgi:hypothetical protein
MNKQLQISSIDVQDRRRTWRVGAIKNMLCSHMHLLEQGNPSFAELQRMQDASGMMRLARYLHPVVHHSAADDAPLSAQDALCRHGYRGKQGERCESAEDGVLNRTDVAGKLTQCQNPAFLILWRLPLSCTCMHAAWSRSKELVTLGTVYIIHSNPAGMGP